VTVIQIGEIGILVPQLYTKGQFRASTFKTANLDPQLIFLGQTRPYT
jgi:hypothetical protein